MADAVLAGGYDNFGDLLEAAASDYPDQVAFVHAGTRLSYAQWYQQALLAAGALARRGVTEGKIAIEVLDESRQPAPAGSVGRVAVRSRFSTRGYWKDPEQSAAVLTAAVLHAEGRQTGPGPPRRRRRLTAPRSRATIRMYIVLILLRSAFPSK